MLSVCFAGITGWHQRADIQRLRGVRHDPGETPRPYVAGTLLAIRKVADVPGVRRGLDSILFEEAATGQ